MRLIHLPTAALRASSRMAALSVRRSRIISITWRAIEYAGDRLTILPGGGITTANRDAVAAALGVSELHGTKIVPLEV